MIIGLSNWGIDVDVTPCLGKGFRIRGTSDVPEYQGKFFISLEIKSFNENGVMVCLDGCQYQAIGGPSLGRNSARLEHFGALNQIVNGSHKNFHAFLTALTSWTKAIQPLPRLQAPDRRRGPPGRSQCPSSGFDREEAGHPWVAHLRHAVRGRPRRVGGRGE